MVKDYDTVMKDFKDLLIKDDVNSAYQLYSKYKYKFDDSKNTIGTVIYESSNISFINKFMLIFRNIRDLIINENRIDIISKLKSTCSLFYRAIDLHNITVVNYIIFKQKSLSDELIIDGVVKTILDNNNDMFDKLYEHVNQGNSFNIIHTLSYMEFDNVSLIKQILSKYNFSSKYILGKISHNIDFVNYSLENFVKMKKVQLVRNFYYSCSNKELFNILDNFSTKHKVIITKATYKQMKNIHLFIDELLYKKIYTHTECLLYILKFNIEEQIVKYDDPSINYNEIILKAIDKKNIKISILNYLLDKCTSDPNELLKIAIKVSSFQIIKFLIDKYGLNIEQEHVDLCDRVKFKFQLQNIMKSVPPEYSVKLYLTDECNICLSKYDDKKYICAVKNCGHTFCNKCLIEMKECPICRKTHGNPGPKVLDSRQRISAGIFP